MSQHGDFLIAGRGDLQHLIHQAGGIGKFIQRNLEPDMLQVALKARKIEEVICDGSEVQE